MSKLCGIINLRMFKEVTDMHWLFNEGSHNKKFPSMFLYHCLMFLLWWRRKSFGIRKILRPVSLIRRVINVIKSSDFMASWHIINRALPWLVMPRLYRHEPFWWPSWLQAFHLWRKNRGLDWLLSERPFRRPSESLFSLLFSSGMR